MPAPPALLQECAKAVTAIARVGARWRVTCPTRVPSTAIPSFSLGGSNLSSTSLRTGYLIDCLGFSRNGRVHWLIAGGSVSTLDYLVDVRDAVGRPEARITSVTRERIGGLTVARYLVAPGSDTLYADHVVLAWRRNGEAYQVSVHRWPTAAVAEAQATALAANLIRQQER